MVAQVDRATGAITQRMDDGGSIPPHPTGYLKASEREDAKAIREMRIAKTVYPHSGMVSGLEMN